MSIPSGITPQSVLKIIKLYHEGATFSAALQNIPSQDHYRKGFYRALAALGTLSKEQAQAILNIDGPLPAEHTSEQVKVCDPPTKPTCSYALTWIAAQVGLHEAEASGKVKDVLNAYFTGSF